MKEQFLHKKLQERKDQNAFRKLKLQSGYVDFCSNDYLGIVKNKLLLNNKNLSEVALHKHGSTGSRLLSGNYALIEETERLIAQFHHAEAGLIFNSGYDANLGLLSCVPQKGDTILYDYLCHASIRDGIRLSLAQAYAFQHNDLEDLRKKVLQAKGNLFIVTESVFSMDGDIAPLQEIAELSIKYEARLIVDEAHATGVVGEHGEGLVQLLGLQTNCFARIHTFGKALGCHGAVILGSDTLRDYLINFCRPFIYSTALPESSVLAMRAAYEIFPALQDERSRISDLALQFKKCVIQYDRIPSESAIHGIIIPGNDAVRELATHLQEENLDVRPILYPTVPKGTERLRIVLHSFNTDSDLKNLVKLLARVQ